MSEKKGLEDPVSWGESTTPGAAAPGTPARSGTGAPASRKPAGFREARSGDIWFLMGCNLIVFASSVCIMVLELTASRLVGKHVGNSLYTWTSVIGVVLAGITIGNFLGGWLADRFEPRRILGWLFLIASVSSLSVLWLDQRVHEIERGRISWPMWVLAVVAGEFLLPAIALGTISPVVASLALSRSARTGITVGNVYAWGALGSIVGTFLTGFFLIDMFGTKAIVGMTSGALAVMGILMASGSLVFRVAVLVGWMQFLLIVVLMSAGNSDSLKRVGGLVGRVLYVASNKDAAKTGIQEWENFGADVGGDLHRLGLKFKLRDDATGEYHDESNYSYINVANDTMNGNAIKYLKLDKLIHSYYNPNDPTALYYDYELVYAAVTDHLLNQTQKPVSVDLPDFPQRDEFVRLLPDNVKFYPEKQQLTADRPLSISQRDELLAVAPSAGYWKAVTKLFQRTDLPNFSGLASEPLDSIPEGTKIPDDIAKNVKFDDSAKLLSAFAKVSDSDFQRLIEAAPASEFYKAVSHLFVQPRGLDTLFIGGGGYVFPRWIVSNYPFSTRIDVAELDPAVKLADQRELGLPADDKTIIKTHIGDARNYIDDRVRENKRLIGQQQAPVLYDFVYGDAFNDFSIPWHLTTREFSQKVHDLLNDHGSFLANVIDIYPRTAAPEGLTASGEVPFRGALPGGISAKTVPGLEIESKSADEHILRFRGVMGDETQQKLLGVTTDGAYQEAVNALRAQTHQEAGLKGPIPTELLAEPTLPEIWTQCRAPFENMEVYVNSGGAPDQETYQIAVRGHMPAELRDKLLALPFAHGEFGAAVKDLYERSQKREEGQFLGRYAHTLADVFPNVYIFSSFSGQPGDNRDTFIVACTMQPLGVDDFGNDNSYWKQKPFAWTEKDPKTGIPVMFGQMEALVSLARGNMLTDNFAPVDNLLAPVFAQQDE